MIRVFPRRTRWTPTDQLAFVGDPPLFRPQQQPVAISVTFTWDIPEAERLYRSWSRFYSNVQLGGPAFNDHGGEFIPGRFVREGVTITSRGCNKECPWCLAWRREGKIRELPVRDGWDVADNNLLACSQWHLEQVFNMLKKQPEPIKFSGGFDAELLTDRHVELLKTIGLRYAWFACDYPGAMVKLERVSELMSDFNREQLRCYVLLGYYGESLSEAEKRLERVFELGFLPFAMLYREDSIKAKPYSREWRNLQRKWCRPAMFKAHMKMLKFPN